METCIGRPLQAEDRDGGMGHRNDEGIPMFPELREDYFVPSIAGLRLVSAGSSPSQIFRIAS